MSLLENKRNLISKSYFSRHPNLSNFYRWSTDKKQRLIDNAKFKGFVQKCFQITYVKSHNSRSNSIFVTSTTFLINNLTYKVMDRGLLNSNERNIPSVIILISVRAKRRAGGGGGEGGGGPCTSRFPYPVLPVPTRFRSGSRLCVIFLLRHIS